MKKSPCGIKIIFTLITISLLAACSSGGGGGGGGSSSSSPSKTTVKVTIPKSTSSDISGDITASDTEPFLYELSFTGSGGTYGPESATPGRTIEFENVTFGSYTFTLTIYSDSNKTVTVGTQQKIQTVSESENTVSFDLKYSDYEKIFLVSSFERFKQILNGLKADGTPYDSSFLTSGETTVYLTGDITIPQQSENIGEAIVNWLSFSTPIKTTIDLCGHTIKTTSDTCVRFNAHKTNITFKNGNMNVYNITFADINDANGTPSKITFDGITAEQPETTTTDTAPSPLFNISCGGTLVLTGGSVAKSTDQTADMTVQLEDSTLVLLGGKVEGTVCMSSLNNQTTAALLGEWNGMTATGANRINKITLTTGTDSFLVCGGDSTVESAECTANSGTTLKIAQSAAISGDAENFATVTSRNLGYSCISLITHLNEDFPAGFTVIDPVRNLFQLEDSETYVWKPNNWYDQDNEPLTAYDIAYREA